MKKLLVAIGLVIAIGLTGCAAAKAEEEEIEAVEVIQEEQSIAIEYVELFLNGTDKEAQKAFVKEKVVEANQPFYETVIALGRAEPTPYNDPKVIEVVELEDKGKQWEYVLVKATDDNGEKEVIVITVDGKFSGAIMPTKDEAAKKMYDMVRSKFKAE